ncbi:MAG: flagellar motor switch protein FliN [Thermoguttaceae bacterium]
MADDSELINQADIEALLQGGAVTGPAKAAAASPPQPKPPAGDGGELDQSEIEKMLAGKGASRSPASPAPAAVVDDADKLLGQDDIEKLLNQSAVGGAAKDHVSPSRTTSATPSAADSPTISESISQGDVEFLLRQAERALESVTSEPKELPPSAAPFMFNEFSGSPANTEVATLDLLNDVELDLKIELGRTNMYLEDVLKLRKGAVVPLDKLAGDPVDIYVNGRLIARGEVLVLNDNFCVRVAELVASTTPVV